MRIDFITRIGLILLILGIVLLFNVWTASFPIQIQRGSTCSPGETRCYSLFMPPVGLGNITLGMPRVFISMVNSNPPGLDFDVPVVVPVHVVIVDPSNMTLVDVDVITPYSVQIDFDMRGEYLLYVTNLDDKPTAPNFCVGLLFPYEYSRLKPEYLPEVPIVNREADKFLVSMILTVGGAVLFCVSLSISLILKYKRVDMKLVGTSIQSSEHLGFS